jgi:tetratricopeptide (TPR) repeat protein
MSGVDSGAARAILFPMEQPVDRSAAGTAPGAVGTLAQALAHTEKLLSANPAAAEQQAREILGAAPGHPLALLYMGVALRRQGAAEAARDVLQSLAATQPKSADVRFELGGALNELGETQAAAAAFKAATALNPKIPRAWLALADTLRLLGDTAGADIAYARHIQASVNEPRLMEAAAALCEGRVAVAERILRPYLKERPTDVSAIRMLAETGTRLGRYDDAGKLLARCMELAPGFIAARHNYATVLYRQGKSSEAIAQLEILLKSDPRNPSYRNLMSAALARLGEHQRAIALYEEILKEHPGQPKTWMSYGHTLRAVGRQQDCIAAYRRSISLSPNLGESYWSLANLKIVRFDRADIAAMQAQLARASGVSAEDRYHLHFALGKALEDERDFEASFRHYDEANRLRRQSLEYDADEFTGKIGRAKKLFTRAFFEARKDWGHPSAEPIFIIGLPRSGSTLIEQILASHSEIEGTMELPDIISIALQMEGKKREGEPSVYPEILERLDAREIYGLGEKYLDGTKLQRRMKRPYFVDKMPNNFLHAGLIHLILPNAKIIDARRHPMAAGFSGFKQHFARGQGFSYDLNDIGRYYADYISLMDHFDEVLPGRIHRVLYEQMVEEPEQEIRRLLDYCGLAFEENCLRFHENERSVRTASSEQVRQPIFRDGLEQWRNYEQWLGPLKSALGPVLADYPPSSAA